MEKGIRLEILFVEETESTQLLLKKLLKEKKSAPPFCVVAEKQTKGVGSRGNSWISIEGNLFFSFCVALKTLPYDLPFASVSIYYAMLMKETLKMLGSKVWVKWPNDFYLNEKKIGGVICEKFEGNIVCGAGLNTKISPLGAGKLDIDIKNEKIVFQFMDTLKQNFLWKQIFSKYWLEFQKSKNFFFHNKKGERISLKDAKLHYDGSVKVKGKRIYSQR